MEIQLGHGGLLAPANPVRQGKNRGWVNLFYQFIPQLRGTFDTLEKARRTTTGQGPILFFRTRIQRALLLPMLGTPTTQNHSNIHWN